MCLSILLLGRFQFQAITLAALNSRLLVSIIGSRITGHQEKAEQTQWILAKTWRAGNMSLIMQMRKQRSLTICLGPQSWGRAEPGPPLSWAQLPSRVGGCPKWYLADMP